MIPAGQRKIRPDGAEEAHLRLSCGTLVNIASRDRRYVDIPAIDIIFHIDIPEYQKKHRYEKKTPVYHQQIEERCLQPLNTVHDFESFDALGISAKHDTGTVKRMTS